MAGSQTARRFSHPLRAARAIIASLRAFGPRITWLRIKKRLKHKRQRIDTGFVLAPQTSEEQRSTLFSHDITISILTPLYNTDMQFLQPMIESVLNQTYQKWELCLTDASDDEHNEVGMYCQQLAAQDPRVRYRKLAANRGIAHNTNACLDLAGGNYLACLDHDDILHPSALFEVMRAIEHFDADMIYSDEITFKHLPEDGYFAHYKPDFSPDTLRSYNYITHFLVFSKKLQVDIGGFRSDFDGSQDYDFILRLSERARAIVHIPRVLYYWRAHAGSVAAGVEAKNYAVEAAKRALTEHLTRTGLRGAVLDALVPTTYKIAYALSAQPLISIIIPNKDHSSDLLQCLHSILQKSSYRHFEVLIVENNSTEEQTFSCYQQLPGLCAEKSMPEDTCRILTYKAGFNYSAINNYAVTQSKGSVLLFLNNDTEVITPDWLEQMLMFCQRPEVAAVGARLLYPDNSVQHAGVILGIGGVAGHAHKHFGRNDFGYASRLQIAQNVSAVTGACLMVKKDLFAQIGGFDEQLAVAFNDIDLCLRFTEQGFLNIFTPFAELYHHESKSRGYEDNTEKLKRFRNESLCFQKRWFAQLDSGDPYYNPHLSLEREDFSMRSDDFHSASDSAFQARPPQKSSRSLSGGVQNISGFTPSSPTK